MKIHLSLLFLLLSHLLAAQASLGLYNTDTIQSPQFKYRALSAELSSGVFNLRNGFDGLTNYSRNGYGGGSLSWLSIVNNDMIQSNARISFGLDKIYDDLEWGQESASHLQMLYRKDKRFYFGSSFWEILPELNLQYESDQMVLLSMAHAIKKGRGRLDPIDDLTQVLWAIKTLKMEGILEEPIPDEKIVEASKKIHEVRGSLLGRNPRKISAMTTMIAKILGQGNDTEIFASAISRSLSGAMRNERYEGRRYAFGGKPFVNYRKNLDSPFPAIARHFGVDLFGEYVVSHNPSLYIQNSFTGKLGFELSQINDYRTYFVPILSANYQFDFFPGPQSRFSIVSVNLFEYEFKSSRNTERNLYWQSGLQATYLQIINNRMQFYVEGGLLLDNQEDDGLDRYKVDPYLNYKFKANFIYQIL